MGRGVSSCVSLATLLWCIAALGVAAPVTAARAQSPVDWSAVSPAAAVPRGGVIHVALKAVIAPGWHMYSLTQPPGGPVALRITLLPGQTLAAAGGVQGPLPELENDPNFGMQVQTYTHAAEFAVPLRAERNAPLGSTTVEISARYQACNATLCLPPHTVKMVVKVNVAERGARSSKEPR